MAKEKVVVENGAIEAEERTVNTEYQVCVYGGMGRYGGARMGWCSL